MSSDASFWDKMISNIRQPVDIGPNQYLPLRFGTELEIVVVPRQLCDTWMKAVEPLSSNLKSRNIGHIVQDSDKKPLAYAYDKLLIMGDLSLDHKPGDNVWGIELVSAINLYHKQDWIAAYDTLYRSVKDCFDLQSSDSCGTHVHVSWSPEWSFAADTLKRVAKAAIYFERCVDSIMPAHRLKNEYCQSNRYNPILETKTMREIFAMIDEQDSMLALANLMCADGKGSNERWYRWNFAPLANPKAAGGTIEFRQPPGSLSEVDAFRWTQFATAFVHGADRVMRRSDAVNLDDVADMDELKTVITQGDYSGLDAAHCSPLELFKGKKKMEEGKLKEHVEHDPNSGAERTAKSKDWIKGERMLEAQQDSASAKLDSVAGEVKRPLKSDKRP